MKTVGLMMVRNEQWVLGLSLPAALMAVDEVVVLDHGSTDGTARIIAEEGTRSRGRVHRIGWPEPEWREAAIRQHMLEVGRSHGGTHFVVIDADEVLTGNLLGSFRGWLSALEPGRSLWLPWLAMWRSLDRFRDDESVWARAEMLVGFADDPGVSYEARAGGYDIHARWAPALERDRVHPVGGHREGGLMHLQFANRRRLVAKHAWYKMTETVRWPGRQTPEELNTKYNRALDETGLACTEIPGEWWAPYMDLRPRVRPDDEPWHEAEARRLWREHGADAFAGLELWGIPEGRAREEAAHAA